MHAFILPLYLCVFASLSLRLVLADPSFFPITPPSWPLAVRNPYLSAWLPNTESNNLPTAIPEFWAGQQLTWTVMARVDGQTYSLFGCPDPVSGVQEASVNGGSYTPTHTVFTLTAGDVSFDLDFFSPVSPSDLLRQSLPFSYLTVSASSNTGEHSVQIYSDIDNSWAGQFGSNVATAWNYSYASDAATIYTVTPLGGAEYSEVSDMAQYGTAVYAAQSGDHLTSQVGLGNNIRSQFVSSGSVGSDSAWTAGSVLGFAEDLGSFSGAGANTTFVVGFVRDDDINYFNGARVGYWRSAFPSIDAAVAHMFDDYDSAVSESYHTDRSLNNQAYNAANGQYSNILALATRQAFGSMDITIPGDSLNTNDVLVFMKEISSDGNVNTLDVIYPTSPIFYVFNPEFIQYLVEPVLQYSETGQYPHNYAIHDIGKAYPNATGDVDAEEMPIEECGNAILLAYMYQKASGKSTLLDQHGPLFKTWADFLVQEGLHPAPQLSSDDSTGVVPNRTGLAIKAAVALNAYGLMTGQTSYSDTGKQFAHTLYNDAVGTDAARTFFTLTQGDPTTWGMGYNLYPDVLLDLQTFPAEAYAMQTSHLYAVRGPAGVAIDSEDTWGKTDWMLWAAATAMAAGVDNTTIRNQFIDDVHTSIANGVNHVPFSDRYFVIADEPAGTVQGGFYAYKNRPVVGGEFAILALKGHDLI